MQSERQAPTWTKDCVMKGRQMLLGQSKSQFGVIVGVHGSVTLGRFWW